MLSPQRRAARPALDSGTIGSAAALAHGSAGGSTGPAARLAIVVGLVCVFLYTFVPVVTSSLRGDLSHAVHSGVVSAVTEEGVLEREAPGSASAEQEAAAAAAAEGEEEEGGESAASSEPVGGVAAAEPPAAAAAAEPAAVAAEPAAPPPPPPSASGTAAASATGSPAAPSPSSTGSDAVGAGVTWDPSDAIYAARDPNAVWPPPQPTPFPARYVSNLVREAKRLGIQVPDVYQRCVGSAAARGACVAAR